MIAQIILTVCASACLGLCVVAALTDINRLTIPNWLNISIAVLFVPAAFASGVPLEILGGHVMAAGLAFVIGFGLFAFRIFGGGDAKMIPAVMLWVGPMGTMEFLYVMGIVGGVLAVIVYLVRKTIPVIIVPGPVRAAFDENGGVPYGVAIAAGAILAGGASPLLQTLPIY